MTKAEELARFVVRANYSDLSREAVQNLKIRVLDSLGCAIGAPKKEKEWRLGGNQWLYWINCTRNFEIGEYQI